MHAQTPSRGARLRALAPLLALLALATLFGAHAAYAADTTGDQGIYGYWKSVDKDSGRTQSIFKLYDDKGKLAGKIMKIYPKKPGEKIDPICTECSGDQKNKPKVGLVFFWNFTPAKDKPRKWLDGKILNPDDGKVYSSEATLSEDGKQLSVYGYIRVLFKIGGTSVWVRPTVAELSEI